MSAIRKLRKLRRNPKAFFNDSDSTAVRTIGKSLGIINASATAPSSPPTPKTATAPAVRPVKPASETTPSKPATTAAAAAAAKDNAARDTSLAAFQTGLAVLEPTPGFGQWDPWAWHAAAPRLSDRGISSVADGNHLLAVFPSGAPSWDAFVLGLLEREGFVARLLRPFDLAEPRISLDDLAWHARQHPFAAHRMALKLLAEVHAAGAAGLVLPHDAAPLTRALSLAARQTGLPTLCLLQPGPHTARAYGSAGRPGSSACNALAWFTGLWPSAPAFAGPLPPFEEICLQDGIISEALAQHAAWSGTGELPLECFGVEPNDNPVVVVAPQGLPGASDTEIADALEAAIRAATADAGQRDHLILVLSARKRGHLTPASLNLLKRLPRKSILLHGDPVPWTGLAKRARRAAAAFPWDAVVLRALGFANVDVGFGSLPAVPSVAQEVSACLPAATYPDLRSLLKKTFVRHDGSGALDAMLQFVERVGSPEPLIDCIAVPDAPANDSITQGRQRYLLALLGARRRVHAFSEPLAGLESEFFVQWGAEPNEAKSRAEVYRSAFARPKLHLEDGFVRSIGLWTDPNEPTCSIVLDPLAVYYDATRPSLLEDWLNSDREISMAERARARKLIDRLTQERISKYNYAPDMDLGLGPAPRRRILLVDQKAGDMSLRYGLASPDTFAQMLTEAVEFADAGGEVLIKQHPCAITGGESEAHYTRKSLVARGAFRPNIHLLGFDINPFALFDPVDEVWVATSGMGLEALFAGRRVRTFGAPFYGGWGLTEDTMVIPRRRRSRTLEDVFHAFYLRLSRYVDPRTGRRCELEDLLDAITAARAELGT